MVATSSFKALAFVSLVAGLAQGAAVQKRSTSGRGTFYNVGMGNCGWSSSSSDYVVALNTAQYGSTSQVSGACGQTITINYNGNSAQAQIVDSCPTCPYGGLDMSTSLFSHLTNGNMGLGEIQVTWDWGSGSSSSNNNNNNNNNDNSNNDQSQSTTSSTSTSSSTSTPTSTSSQAVSTATPTNTATKTEVGVPEWWSTIGNSGCEQVALPQGVEPVGIAPSGNAELADLPAACGKWVQVWNTANNKTTKGMVTTYLPGSDRGAIIMADAYKVIADMNGNAPNAIQEAKWGFLN